MQREGAIFMLQVPPCGLSVVYSDFPCPIFQQRLIDGCILFFEAAQNDVAFVATCFYGVADGIQGHLGCFLFGVMIHTCTDARECYGLDAMLLSQLKGRFITVGQ